MKRKATEDASRDQEKKKSKKQTSFSDIISSLKQRLAEEQNTIPALKEFIKHIHSEDATEFVTCYLKTSPEGKELFTLFGMNGRPPPEKLQLIWEVFEGILSVTSEHKDDRLLISSGSFLTSKLIENHSKAIYASFGMNSKDSLLKAILKCLTYMLAQNKQSMKDVLTNFDFGHRGFKAASRKRDRKQQPDVRTCFVRFCLAFFVFGDMGIIIKMLEEKGFGALILNDLHQDTTETIQVVLETLFNKVVNNEGILKKTKLLFFSAPVLSKLTLLCRNPDEDVRNSVMNLLTVLSTDTKKGILFYPRNEVHTGKLMNVILMKFLQYTRQNILSQPSLMQLAVDIMKHGPDIIVPYINVLNLSMEPRHSDAYYADMEFLIKIWRNIPLVSEIQLDLNVNKSSEFLTKLVVPSAVSKMQFAVALKNKNKKIQLLSFELLEAILKRCIDLKELILQQQAQQQQKQQQQQQQQQKKKQQHQKNVLDDKRQTFLDSLTHTLPDVKNIITVRQNIVIKEAKSIEEKVIEDSDEEDKDDNEEEAIMSTTEDIVESDMEGSSGDLFSLSMKLLWYYQKMKPGVLTESGFNVCKLLLMPGNVTEETLDNILDILILEQTDTRMWLEKKISGGKNIIQMVLETIVEHNNNQNIVQKGKFVFFKILDLIEDCRMFSHEFELWVDELRSLFGSSSQDEMKMTIKKFSDSCLRFLNEPYMLQQHVASLFTDNKDNESLKEYEMPERGFSPLVATVVRRFTKTDCSELDKRFLTSSLQRMIAYQENANTLLQVLWKETEDYREIFQHVFSFSQKFLDMLGQERELDFTEDTSDVDDVTMENGERDVFSMITIFLQMPCEPKKNQLKKTMKQINKLHEEIKSNLIKYPNKLVQVKTLWNVINLSRKPAIVSQCTDALESTLRMILEYLEVTLDCQESSNSIHGRVCDVVLNIFESISDTKDDMWKQFARDVTALVFDHLSLERIDDDTKATSPTRNVLKNILRDLDKEQCMLLQRLIPHLPEDLINETLHRLVQCLSDKDTLANMSDCLAQTFDALRTKCLSFERCVVDDVLKDVDMKKLFLSSIKASSGSQMRLFYSIFSFLPMNTMLNSLTYKHLSKLYTCPDPIFLKVAILLVKSNKKICDAFIQGIIAHDFQTSDVRFVSRIVPVMESVLLVRSPDELPADFVKTLTKDIWNVLLDMDVLEENIALFMGRIVVYAEKSMILKALSSVISMLGKVEADQTVLIDQLLSLVKKFLSNLNETEWVQQIEVLCHLMQLLKDQSSLDCKKVYLSYLTDILKMTKLPTSVAEQSNSDRDGVKKLLSLWKPFVVYVLKEHYKDASYLNMLSIAVGKLYSYGAFKNQCSLSAKDVYQMIIGHSNFLDIFIDEGDTMKECKDELVTLLHAVAQHSTSASNAAFIPVVLMAYNASLTETDRRLLSLLRIFEQDGNSLSQHSPLSWGSNAIEVYKEKQSKKDYLNDPSAVIFNALDVKVVTKTAYEFPVHLKFNENDFSEEMDVELYDPRFLLLLFASCFQPGQHVNCKLFFESGCLMLTIAALTSYDDEIRKIAYFILMQYQDFLDSSRFREKTQVVYLLMLLKNSICEENLRLQSIWGAYLCRYISVLLRADHDMYPVLNHQLLRKPTLSLRDLPVFLQFLHSASMKHANERFWLLKLLLNGLKDQSGYYLYKRNNVFELVIACHDSSFVDKKCKVILSNPDLRCFHMTSVADADIRQAAEPIIVDLITTACKIFHAAFDLVKVHSLLSWIGSCLVRVKTEEEKSRFINLLYTLHTTFKNKQQENQSNKKEDNKAEFPKVFPNESLLLCTHCLCEWSSLPFDDLLHICSIMVWVLCNTSEHSEELCTWMSVEDCTNLLYALEKLLLEAEKEHVCDVAALFNQIISSLVDKNNGIILPLLSKLSWQKIHDRAAENNIRETLDLFSKLQKWRDNQTNHLSNFFQTLIQCGL